MNLFKNPIFDSITPLCVIAIMAFTSNWSKLFLYLFIVLSPHIKTFPPVFLAPRDRGATTWLVLSKCYWMNKWTLLILFIISGSQFPHLKMGSLKWCHQDGNIWNSSLCLPIEINNWQLSMKKNSSGRSLEYTRNFSNVVEQKYWE